MKYLFLSLLFVGCSNLPTTPNDTQVAPRPIYARDTAEIVLKKAMKGRIVKDNAQCETLVETILQEIIRNEDTDSTFRTILTNCIER